MNKVILIIGLPASGKTTYAKAYATCRINPDDYILIDDPKDFDRDVLPHLLKNKNLVITDPTFCIKKTLDFAINKILSIKEVEIKKLYFENNKDKALINAAKRKDKKVTEYIKMLSKQYEPETIDLLIDTCQ